MSEKNSVFRNLFRRIKKTETYPIGLYILRWLLICGLLGFIAGSVSAIFLVALDFVTNIRENNFLIIALLPLAGFSIGLLYQYAGKGVEKGNNQILEEIENPQKVVPFKMAPLVFIGTLITHLFGGSAGREGTAVQMAGSISDKITTIINLKERDRKIMLIAGVSAGFASVFGTPMAGAVFGLEVFVIGVLRYEAILPAFLAAIIANYVTTEIWGVGHTYYIVNSIPPIDLLNLLYCMLAGAVFGLTARVFGNLNHLTTNIFKNINYPPFRPVAGGIIVAAFVLLSGSTRYIGLGIPVITEAFEQPVPFYDFAVKILLTAITLGSSFKGGEVTPLFFIGATLGNLLSFFIPLPLSLLAALGFVAVLSGAANTPLATTLVAIEIFGTETGIYAAIACVVSYLFSGHSSIYTSQTIGTGKHLLLKREEGRKIFSISGKRRNKS
jgi:H+/Cl- antiporter ClcA